MQLRKAVVGPVAALVAALLLIASIGVRPAVAAKPKIVQPRTCSTATVIHCMAVAQPVTGDDATYDPNYDGYSPDDLAQAYNIPADLQAKDTNAIVAVIDAYYAPFAYEDWTAYRAQFKMPACPRATSTATPGCWFMQVGQNGPTGALPKTEPGAGSGDFSWADETTLDVEMVSAICPKCRVLLVEADNPDSTVDAFGGVHPSAKNMEKAVTEAVSLGANYVSMSWGQNEYSGEHADDAKYYGAKNVIYVAAAGDTGFDASRGLGPSWPADSDNVVSVGGTSLVRTPNTARGYTETAWSGWYGDGSGSKLWRGTGSGCSPFEPRPIWQSVAGQIAASCARRAGTDVSIDADPGTGVAVYQSDGGWQPVGGTSAGTPMIAAMYALAGNTSQRWAPYAHPTQFNDVLSGTNTPGSPAVCARICQAGSGWDGPTGLGSPNGDAGFAPGGLVLRSPNNPVAGIGQAVSWSTHTIWAAGTSYAVTGGRLPAGLKLGADGVVRGRPTKIGSGSTIITATSTSQPSSQGTTIFRWTIKHAFSHGAARIGGIAKVGGTLRAAIGTLRQDRASGPIVRGAKVKVQWFKGGRPIKGATGLTLKITKKLAGWRISYVATVSRSGYVSYTTASPRTRVIR